jgi:hypothetical protein
MLHRGAPINRPLPGPAAPCASLPQPRGAGRQKYRILVH